MTFVIPHIDICQKSTQAFNSSTQNQIISFSKDAGTYNINRYLSLSDMTSKMALMR